MEPGIYVRPAPGVPEQFWHIGIRIEDPEVNFATLAKGYGVYGEGRIEDPDELGPALRRVVKMCVEDRRPALLDVHCRPR